MKTAISIRLGLVSLAVATVAAGSNWSIAQVAPAAIGVAASVVKEVKLSNAQSPRPRPVAVRQRIALADLIQTGKASQLQILLLDRSSFSIGANASLRIDRFVYDPARGRSLGAGVARGAFRFMSGQSNRQNSATIATPVATIGIRGTMLDGVVGEQAQAIARDESKQLRDARADAATATLVVLRGPGARTEGGEQVGAASVTSGGVTIELTEPMQASFIPRAGAAPIGPFRISSEGLARLQNQVQPRLAEGSGSSLLSGILKALPAASGLIGGGKGRTGGGQPPPPPPPPGQPGKP